MNRREMIRTALATLTAAAIAVLPGRARAYVRRIGTPEVCPWLHLNIKGFDDDHRLMARVSNGRWVTFRMARHENTVQEVSVPIDQAEEFVTGLVEMIQHYGVQR